MGKLEPQGSSLHQSVPLVRIVMDVIKMETSVVLVMPTRITQEPAIVSIMLVLNTSFTTIETWIVSAEKTRRRNMA
jgi:hypothetical protein